MIKQAGQISIGIPGLVTVVLLAVWNGMTAEHGNTLFVDVPIPRAVNLNARTIDRAPLRLIAAQPCDGCRCAGHANPRIPCAMYAPGFKPKNPNLDHLDARNVSNFVIENPSWKWPQPGGLGTNVIVTYSYSNLLNGNLPGGLSSSQLQSAIEEALAVWAAQAPLIFLPKFDSGPSVSDNSYEAGNTPNIRFGHHQIDVAGNVLAHAYAPFDLNSGVNGLAGDIHFDSADTWSVIPGSGKIDIIEVAVHEIGHALGLAHEPVPPVGNYAIMNPSYGSRYSGLGSAFILQDDINGIQAIYGGRGCPIIALVNQAKQLPIPLKGLKIGALNDPTRFYTDLRYYRDRVLQGTPAGRQLVAIYYQHGPEVMTVLAQRPDLMLQAMSLLGEVHRPIVHGEPLTEIVRMPAPTLDRAIKFLQDLESEVGDDARAALVHARSVVAAARSVEEDGVALDFRAVK